MANDTDKPGKDAQLLLSQAIYQLKQGVDSSLVLPALESVLQYVESNARHDALTGALNNRTLLAMLNVELTRSYRTGHTFSLVVFAVDDFAELMNKLGSPVGVQVLCQVTEVAQNMLRTLDSFGRATGHEFAIVMPTTWVDQSIKAIARLRIKLDEVDWATIAPGLRVNFSTGITHNAPGDTSDAMMQRAQQALAQAQAKGTGSVVQIEPELPTFDPD